MKNRNVGIDLLRIISMFFIVLLHILEHGGILENANFFDANYAVAWIIEICAYCAVNCYALISGYVGCEGKFKISNIVLLWLQVQFYNCLFTLIFICLFKVDELSFSNIYNMLLPVISDRYWYFTQYYGLFFFMPLLNTILKTADKKSIRFSLVCILFVLSIIQGFFYKDVFGTNNGYSLLWLMVLYLIGGYIKKFNITMGNKIKLFIGYMGIVCITFIFKMIIQTATNKIFGEPKLGRWFIRYTSPMILAASLCLFLIFESVVIRKKHICVVNKLSRLTFGVYLVHDNPFVRDYLIKNSFLDVLVKPWGVEILCIFGSAMLIYTICSLIDFLRYKVFELCKIKKRIQILDKYFDILFEVST